MAFPEGAPGSFAAAGKQIPLELDRRCASVDGEPELEAVAYADQRGLGMTSGAG